MLSVVTIAPNGQGTLHHHPEEQWGVLLEGSAIRVQGDEEIRVKKGDFWRTPGGVPHTCVQVRGRTRAGHFQPAATRIQEARQRICRLVATGEPTCP